MRLFAALLAIGLALSAHAERPAADVQKARELAREGMRLYDLGEFDNAIAKFRESYALDANPAVLFNMAQANRFKHNFGQAARLYESFLRQVPHARNRLDVEALIAEMKKKVAEEDLMRSVAPSHHDEETQPLFAPTPPELQSSEVKPSAPVMVMTSPPPAKKRPLRKQWWLWTVVGTAAAAVAIGVGVGVATNPSYLPSGKLGTIDAR